MRLTTHAIVSRALNLAAAVLPDHLAARFDGLVPTVADGFGGAFNGQQRRIEAVRAIFEAIPFQAIVETGTYRGTTTAFLNELSEAPIATIEAQRRFYLYAGRRFREVTKVSVILGDSGQVLRRLAMESPWKNSPAFFYLDAHWLDRLPLVEEIGVITASWRDAVIVIDDVRVPEDPGYGFDVYGGVALDLDLVQTATFERLIPYWPAASSSAESGAKRGWVVLATPGEIDQRLSGVDALRRAEEISGSHDRNAADVASRRRHA
jgi:hypothetical protein